MKIEQIDGNLLDFPSGINVVGHCANCNNTFGSGIALQIKNRYPEAYEVDTKFYLSHKNVPGSQLGSYSSTQVLKDLFDPKYIINLYGQDNGGRETRQVNYEAIYTAMEKLRNKICEHNVGYTLGFPYKMGCDRAGGDWRIVYAMIETLFGDSGFIKIYIVKYPEPKKG